MPECSIITETDVHAKMTPQALLYLLSLVSPSLPVGAYAYSQGLEYAVQKQWINNEAECLDWISGVYRFGFAATDLPIGWRLHRSWTQASIQAVDYWNAYLWAFRESKQIQMQEQHLAGALAKLLDSLHVPEAAQWQKREQRCFLSLYTLAAVHWHIPADAALLGLSFSWVENLVLAAVRLIPLGHTAGQRILHELIPIVTEEVYAKQTIDDAFIGQNLPGSQLAMIQHEQLYSRLFRS